jgi:hypothetical protein
MPRTSPYRIVLNAQEQKAIEAIARQYTSPYYQVIRAKIVLMASKGIPNNLIADRLDLPRQIVSKWRKRFFSQRLEGLEDVPRPGRPSGFSPSGRRPSQGPSL